MKLQDSVHNIYENNYLEGIYQAIYVLEEYWGYFVFH